VTGILRLGGTMLGTVNRGDPFVEPIVTPQGTFDYGDRVIEMFGQMELDALVCIGGDGTLAISYEFYKKGIPLVCVPKTIDNDIVGTTSCFGFDTAVSFATDAIDRLHSTAEAHRRIMVVEVMGRYAGWIALHSGMAGGADVILIPEIPYDLERVAACIRDRDKLGARFSIVVVAEGAHPKDGAVALIEAAHGGHVERLGGIGIRCAAQLEELTGKETRYVVLGHLQRGGSPTAFDRTLATRFGGKAVELLIKGQFGKMVANHPPDLVPIPLGEVVGKTKTVPLDYDLLLTARALGVSFGD
jgi:6-phosphofructokinase 1